MAAARRGGGPRDCSHSNFFFSKCAGLQPQRSKSRFSSKTLAKSILLLPKRIWLLLVPPGCSRLLLVPPGCSWLLLASPGCSRLLLAAPGCSLLVPAAPGCSWRLRAAPGCSWLLSLEFYSWISFVDSSPGLLFQIPLLDSSPDLKSHLI